MRINIQVTYIFIPIVLHKDSFCHRGKSKLGIGLFIHELLREPLIHLDVCSTLHRKTLTHILPIRQVRSNCVISFMAITTALTGISKCGSCVSFLGRGFFKFFTFSAFFLKFKLSFLPLFVGKLFTWTK